MMKNESLFFYLLSSSDYKKRILRGYGTIV